MTGKVITIAQQKGGAGKTTICINLATALLAHAEPSKTSVAILDTDPQGSLGRWFMKRRELLGEDNTGFQFRTASAWGARFEARELAKTHDYVILDTPPSMSIDGRPSIEAADLVLIPLTASYLDVWATQPTQELALAEKKPILAVLNRVSGRARITSDVSAALDKLNLPHADTQISNRVLYAESVVNGRGVVEMRPNGPAAKEIKTLCAEVIEKLNV